MATDTNDVAATRRRWIALLAKLALVNGTAATLYGVGSASFRLSPRDPSYKYSPTKRKDSIGGGLLMLLGGLVFFCGNAAIALALLLRRAGKWR